MKLNILLIEDNIVDSFLVDEQLNAACPNKYVIKSASSLRQGLEFLDSGNFDIVLTDLGLPDASGLKAVTSIQDHDPSIPIVVLSGNENEKLALQIVQMGAQDYLIKGQGDGHLINRSIGYAIERKNHEKQLVYLANYDSLTGLANRGLFRDRLDRALIRASRNKTLVALFLIDLDKFKLVNDTLGHDAGDELLIQVARRFESCTRKGDTIARLGGDEFTIITEDIKNLKDTTTIAEKLSSAMSEPVCLSFHEINVNASIGISIYPSDGLKPNDLVKYADIAMYYSKNHGRNCYHFFSEDMMPVQSEKQSVEEKPATKKPAVKLAK